jgi:hypothetical protein
VQTEDPYWLKEAYKTPISDADLGYLSRNEVIACILDKILRFFLRIKPNAACLDYGGGLGVFVRLMRDRGHHFFWYDPYAQNLFAKGFAIKDPKQHKQFACLSLCEVFEHMVNPKSEFESISDLAPHIFFTTELLPERITKVADWWYFTPETGQHISFHTQRSLQHLMQQSGFHLITNGRSMHLATRRPLKYPRIANFFFKILCSGRIARLLDILPLRAPPSLLQKDFSAALNRLRM